MKKTRIIYNIYGVEVEEDTTKENFLSRLSTEIDTHLQYSGEYEKEDEFYIEALEMLLSGETVVYGNEYSIDFEIIEEENKNK